MKKSKFTVRELAVIGLLSALVFVFSWLQIPLGTVARIHLGNVFCALSGLLFGPLAGGLAAGFGSMLFDLTNPAYIAECWITFLTKFFIGFLAGAIAQRGKISLKTDVLGAAVGSGAYVGLYLTKSFIMMHFIEGQAMGAIQLQLITKGITSLINAVLAVIVSVLLARLTRPALRRAGILPPEKTTQQE
ncbi:MAG: ECF transporter S component [Ruthenibacterium sp.]